MSETINLRFSFPILCTQNIVKIMYNTLLNCECVVMFQAFCMLNSVTVWYISTPNLLLLLLLFSFVVVMLIIYDILFCFAKVLY